MTTKTFRAENMLIALQEVQRELGPNAVVLSVREIPAGPVWQAWKKPGFEVVAMNNVPEQANEKNIASAGLPGFQAPRAGAPEAGKPASNRTPMNWKPPVLRRDGETVSEPPAVETVEAIEARSLPRVEPAPLPVADIPVVLGRARRQLLEQGVAESLVDRLVGTCLQVLTPSMQADDNRLIGFLQRQLEAGVKSSNRSPVNIPSRVMCLVGSSGSGKTSTCAKLASFYALTLGKRVAWVSADTIRAGAIAEARIFTDNLGIPLHLAYTPQELAAAIAACAEADLVLVDTPGCNPRMEEKVVELGAFLSEIPQRGTYLVAAATTKDVDLNQALAAFGPFSMKGVVFTKVDETGSYGGLYNLAWRSQLPVVFFTTGPQVMGDLRTGNPADLALALLTGRFPMRVRVEDGLKTA